MDFLLSLTTMGKPKQNKKTTNNKRQKSFKTTVKKPKKNDNTREMQFVIDALGCPKMLRLLALYLGQENCDVVLKEEIPNVRNTRNLRVPSKFTGLGFDGVHWKGYVNGKFKYDSYGFNVQLPGSNNYCQSYACFLWASKGLKNSKHNTQLVKKQFTKNVMTMSKVWVNCFKSLNKEQSSVMAQSLSELEDSKHFDLQTILEKMSADEVYAHEFANSKESLF
jgi:hypothetical protein